MKTAKYRDYLPQLNGKPCVTEGGAETTLLFHDGLDLPLFASFPLLDDEKGRAAIDRYTRHYYDIALRNKMGFIMDTVTWRASKRWADELGVSQDELNNVQAKSLDFLMSLRDELETSSMPMIISGTIGPQDDGYNPNGFLKADEAQAYHSQQIAWLAECGADMVSAITMTYAQEVIGIAKAAKDIGIPCVISFTLETDGRLPSGQTLKSAIEEVDRETGNAPAYYMINCAHPEHFEAVLLDDGTWKNRIMGLRPNASRMSHEELDNSEELDIGNPKELGTQYKSLMELLPNLMVYGGCCGTDHRHVEEICSACNFAAAA